MTNETLELEALVLFGLDNICVMDKSGNMYSVVHPKNYDVNNYRELNDKKYYKRITNKEEKELILDIIYTKENNL